jgi:hypothetical protein
MARSSHPTLLLVVLAGLSAGLWLAAHTGGTAAKGQGLEPEGAPTSATSADRAETLLDAPEEATSVRTRPRREPRNVPLVPKPGETWLSVTFETQDGSMPKGARIAQFTTEDGHPVFPPFATFAAGDDGAVAVCTKVEQDCDVVLFAPGFEPASQHILATSTGKIDLEFVLERGATVSGRVTAGDVPLPRAEIEALAVAPGYEARVEGGSLGWRAGRFVWCAARGETGADGTYAIRGLDPGEHKLRMCTVRQRNVAIDVQKVATLRANAPADDADFVLPAARLDLTFESSGAPLCCVEVQIEAGDRFFMRRTDEAGRLGFLIQPELAYGITAARFGFTTVHTQLRGLTDGEHRPEKLALEPQQELATLVIADNGTADADRVSFDLHPRFPTGDAPADMHVDAVRDPSTRKFPIPNVPSGSWRVTMRSGSPLWTGIGASSQLRTTCDQDVLVQVPDHGSVEAQISANERGGLLVSTQGADGAPIEASVRLLDKLGVPVEGTLVLKPPPVPAVRADTGRIVAPARAPQGAEIQPGRVAVYASWCAGTADIEVSAPGMETVTKRVAITVGELTPVSVVLRPK